MQKLLEFIHSGRQENWPERSREAFTELFGSDGGRYPERVRQSFSLRAPDFGSGPGVPFTALIDPSNPNSGAYGGMSFVIIGAPPDFGYRKAPVINGC